MVAKDVGFTGMGEEVEPRRSTGGAHCFNHILRCCAPNIMVTAAKEHLSIALWSCGGVQVHHVDLSAKGPNPPTAAAIARDQFFGFQWQPPNFLEQFTLTLVQRPVLCLTGHRAIIPAQATSAPLSFPGV